jgi:hypothetical protein
VLNISGLRSSPARTALTGLVLTVFGIAGGWPPLAIVGVLLLALAALGLLRGRSKTAKSPRRGVHRGLGSEGGGSRDDDQDGRPCT